MKPVNADTKPCTPRERAPRGHQPRRAFPDHRCSQQARLWRHRRRNRQGHRPVHQQRCK